ncbi:unnamed protein product [Prorocentrum cordatum]|uniref:Amine oxidase n=1 Tax=Prorocentrum cordatum TaxID=2364126 RepID=A0ABN9UI68_9DINO|nr:unnamed protein product [Polarella glacialis]
MAPKGCKTVEGGWPRPPESRVSSPAPTERSGGASSWDKLSLASGLSAGSPPFLAPTSQLGGLGLLPLPAPETQELMQRLALDAQQRQAVAAAGPAPTAKAKRATGRWGAGLRAATRCCFGRRWGVLSQCALLLLAVTLVPAWLAASLSRSVGAVVTLSKDLADATGATAQGTISVVHEAWTGVDLADTVVNASGARFIIVRSASRKEFEESELAAMLHPLPPEYRQWLWTVVSTVGSRAPRVAASECQFKTASYFDFFEFEAVSFENGVVGVRFMWTRMVFKAVWSNPVWELLGIDVSSELSPIASRTRDMLAGALDLEWLRAPLTENEDVVRMAPPLWYRWLQWGRRHTDWLQIASGFRDEGPFFFRL